MNKFKRFFEPIKQTPIVYIRGVLIFLWWGLNGVVHVLFLERLTFFLELGNKTEFNRILFYYLAFLVIYEIIFFATGKYGRTDVYNQTIINIQKKYLKDFIELDNNKVEGIGTGKMVAIIKGGIDMWGRLMTMIVESISQVVTILFFTLYMLFRVNYIYGIIFIFLYIFFHLVSGYFNSKVIPIRIKRREAKNIYTKHFVRVLMSKFEILQSNKISKETDLLDKYQYKEINYNREMSFFMNLLFRVPELGMDLILLAVFIYFGNQVLSGNINLSVFVGISGMLILMKNAITRSVDVYKNFTKEFVDIEKLWDLYDNTQKISGYENGKSFEYKKGDIKLNNINFAYNESSKSILNDFSISVKGGKLTALVGSSGSGKSTIVKLISGYIKSDTGSILVDGQDLSGISLKSYYKNIGYLTQEPSVFDGSIIDNLVYAIDRKVTDDEISEIIKLSKCEFIYDFKEGIHTQIGEKGVKLSGGQKQRLAIAKVFLKNPKIIILDEPTSALDSFSEEKIIKAMNNLFVGRTVIVIAHRLQTVRHADEIFVLSQGKIVEFGTHEKLIKTGGIYKEMLDLQSGF